MSIKTTRFFTVEMPDGIEYCAIGRSKKEIARIYFVPEKNIKAGATLHEPLIGEYVEKTRLVSQVGEEGE